MASWRASLLAIAVLGLMLGAEWRSSAQQKPLVSVMKSPTCGCCSKWVEHLKAAGFETRVQDVEDMNALKTKLGITPAISSCHTAQVEGYVIEGHVPAASIQKLLKEKPKVAGLTVPGMPAGSPGMELPSGHREPYSVLTFDKNGQTAVYQKY